MTAAVELDSDQAPAGAVRQTAAERRAMPNFADIAEAAAEKYGVCVKPVTMRVVDPTTGTVSYIGAPCKATISSVCKPCADKARWLRMTQCREGWHRDSEPVQDTNDPTGEQVELLTARADSVDRYHEATAAGDDELAEGFRDIVASLDLLLRESGFRGPIPALDPKKRKRRVRSTSRRQDVPDLPRRKVSGKTLGRIFAGKHRPSMMVTLTLPSYGHINRDGATDKDGNPCPDGSPRHPDSYDYARAARDIIFFSNLIDRWIKNLRRCVGWDVQYFATVEPQKRGAPHAHILIRGAISRETLRMVTEGTYFQAWWPHFDPENEVYSADRMPVWDYQAMTFVDPDTKQPLTGWDDALDRLASVDNWTPAHVARFGTQMDAGDMKGVVPGKEADKTIGYVTKYLTKSIAEVLDTESVRTAVHYDRLHTELAHTPCSPNCAVWLRYGIIPKSATDKTIPGRCRGKAHRRDTLGLPGRRVLNSRRWSGKTLPDHKADRVEFVRQLLAEVGIHKPDTSHLIVRPVEPGDQSAPPRDQLIMATIAQRTTWRAEYTNALLAASPPGAQETSAIRQAA
ncbi:replication initiator [Nocardia sp. R16R-3T]